MQYNKLFNKILSRGLTWGNFIIVIVVITLLNLLTSNLIDSGAKGISIWSALSITAYAILFCYIYYLRLIYLEINKLFSLIPLLALMSNPRLHIYLGINTSSFYDNYIAMGLDGILLAYAIYFFIRIDRKIKKQAKGQAG
ncbi:MAG TPA: hypothetical protein ENJ08_14405 [Gammaproteobacteria bacterium]|nr:hypothetical protein [Gammaproteobacteria bacterium]